MRLVHAALVLAASISPALAQRGPVIVIPGRPDVPVLLNGVDISWSVVEGDFGLARPGLVTPTVIYRPPPVIVPFYAPSAYGPGYYPKDNKKPGYGRLEIVPPANRPLPPPAPSYRRSWSSSSAPTPPDYPSYTPTYVAPVIAPTFNGPQPGPQPYPPGPQPPGPPQAGTPPNPPQGGPQPPPPGPPQAGTPPAGPPPNGSNRPPQQWQGRFGRGARNGR
jgi:hypothetical protein